MRESGADTLRSPTMRGAVAAGNRHTAEAGAWALAQGGTAVDAVVAAALAAFVAEGPLTGPGGGGFLLAPRRRCRADPARLLLRRPSRPQEPMDEVLIDFGDASTQVFHVGAGVGCRPRARRGARRGARRHGRLPWAALFEPALELARAGVEMSGPQRFLLEILVPILERTDGGPGIYGSHVRAETAVMVPGLELLRDHGAAAVAELMPGHAADLAAYRVVERRRSRRRSAGCGSSRARRRRRAERSSPEGSPRSTASERADAGHARRDARRGSARRLRGRAQPRTADGHDPRLGDRRRRERGRALVDARVRLGRLRPAASSSTTCWASST